MSGEAINEAVRQRIEDAGQPCAVVYRVWSPGESDLLLDDQPAEVAIFIDDEGQPHTAAFAKDGSVVVAEGW